MASLFDDRNIFQTLYRTIEIIKNAQVEKPADEKDDYNFVSDIRLTLYHLSFEIVRQDRTNDIFYPNSVGEYQTKHNNNDSYKEILIDTMKNEHIRHGRTIIVPEKNLAFKIEKETDDFQNEMKMMQYLIEFKE